MPTPFRLCVGATKVTEMWCQNRLVATLLRPSMWHQSTDGADWCEYVWIPLQILLNLLQASEIHEFRNVSNVYNALTLDRFTIEGLNWTGSFFHLFTKQLQRCNMLPGSIMETGGPFWPLPACCSLQCQQLSCKEVSHQTGPHSDASSRIWKSIIESVKPRWVLSDTSLRYAGRAVMNYWVWHVLKKHCWNGAMRWRTCTWQHGFFLWAVNGCDFAWFSIRCCVNMSDYIIMFDHICVFSATKLAFGTCGSCGISRGAIITGICWWWWRWTAWFFGILRVDSPALQCLSCVVKSRGQQKLRNEHIAARCSKSWSTWSALKHQWISNLHPVSAPSAPSAPRLFTEMRIGLRAEAWSQPWVPPSPNIAQQCPIRLPWLPLFSRLRFAAHWTASSYDVCGTKSTKPNIEWFFLPPRTQWQHYSRCALLALSSATANSSDQEDLNLSWPARS